MMNKHLPEILSLNVEELRYTEGPVKRHRHHVIPPYIIRHRVKRVTIITIIYIPQPRFVPENDNPVDKRVRVIQASPARKQKPKKRLLRNNQIANDTRIWIVGIQPKIRKNIIKITRFFSSFLTITYFHKISSTLKACRVNVSVSATFPLGARSNPVV